MKVLASRIKDNDGSFKGNFHVTTSNVVVVRVHGDPNFDYMCLNGHNRVKAARGTEIEVEVIGENQAPVEGVAVQMGELSPPKVM